MPIHRNDTDRVADGNRTTPLGPDFVGSAGPRAPEALETAPGETLLPIDPDLDQLPGPFASSRAPAGDPPHRQRVARAAAAMTATTEGAGA